MGLHLVADAHVRFAATLPAALQHAMWYAGIQAVWPHCDFTPSTIGVGTSLDCALFVWKMQTGGH